MIWLLIIGGLLGFGFLVDFIAKRKGIEMNPEENAKHVSESQRIYTETHLDSVKNNHNDGMGF